VAKFNLALGRVSRVKFDAILGRHPDEQSVLRLGFIDSKTFVSEDHYLFVKITKTWISEKALLLGCIYARKTY
jgi:hypothetical protein